MLKENLVIVHLRLSISPFPNENSPTNVIIHTDVVVPINECMVTTPTDNRLIGQCEISVIPHDIPTEMHPMIKVEEEREQMRLIDSDCGNPHII